MEIQIVTLSSEFLYLRPLSSPPSFHLENMFFAPALTVAYPIGTAIVHGIGTRTYCIVYGTYDTDFVIFC